MLGSCTNTWWSIQGVVIYGNNFFLYSLEAKWRKQALHFTEWWSWGGGIFWQVCSFLVTSKSFLIRYRENHSPGYPGIVEWWWGTKSPLVLLTSFFITLYRCLLKVISENDRYISQRSWKNYLERWTETGNCVSVVFPFDSLIYWLIHAFI